MRTRSGRRYHPYSGRPKRAAPRFKSRGTQTPRRAASRPQVQTSKLGNAISVRFKGRKTTVRQYRNYLWRNTQFMTHYRSINQGFNAPLSIVLGTPGTSISYLMPALNVNSVSTGFITGPNAFWAAGGGLQTPDVGVAVPTFIGDITLRGGICRLMCYSREDIQVRVKIYAIWAQKQPSQAVYTALNGASHGADWDPSCQADFSTTFGKIMYEKQAILDQGNSIEVVHRMKVQKIDRDRFLGSATQPSGSTLWWMVVFTCNDVNAGNAGMPLVNSWNLSCTGDVIS